MTPDPRLPAAAALERDADRDPESLDEWRTVKELVDWLYEQGPNPDELPREALLARYAAHRRAASTSVRNSNGNARPPG